MLDPQKWFIPRATSEEGRYEWLIPADLPYFEGHFPGNPILPAVALVESTLRVLEVHLKAPLSVREIKSAKFFHPVMPGEKLFAHLHKQLPEVWRCQWSDESGDQKIALIDVVLSTEWLSAMKS